MKNKSAYGILMAVTAVMALMFSCGKQPVTEPEIVFPELRNFQTTSGNSLDINFDAAADWKLVSDKIWCTFSNDAGSSVNNIGGKAGPSAVRVSVGAEGLSFDTSDEAVVSITMKSVTKEFARVVRLPKEYRFKILDMEGKELKQLTVGYKTPVPFTVVSNFPFSATAWDSDVVDLYSWTAADPSFLTDGIAGSAGSEVMGAAVIICNGEREKYAFSADAGRSITFSNEKGSVKYSYPLVFEGMDREEICLGNISPEISQKDWDVTYDGKVFRHFMGSDADSLKLSTQYVEVDVVCYNNDFEVFALDDEDQCPSWLHCEKLIENEGGIISAKLRLTVDANPAERQRSASLYALPRAVYEREKADLPAFIARADYDLLHQYTLISLRQLRYFAPVDFQEPIIIRDPVYDSNWEPDMSSFTVPLDVLDAETKAALCSSWNVKHVYSCTMPSNYHHQIGVVPCLEHVSIDNLSGAYDTDSAMSCQLAENEHLAAIKLYHLGKLLEAQSDYELGEVQLSNYHVEGNFRTMELAVKLGSPSGGWSGEAVYVLFLVDGAPEELVVVNPPI